MKQKQCKRCGKMVNVEGVHTCCSPSEDYAQKIIKAADSRGEFVADLDGFVYWYPLRNNGHLSAAQLRVLAGELDKRNKRWQQDIDNYFESNAANQARSDSK